MSLADELRKLQELRQTGAISEEEFAKAKAGLLNAPPASSLDIEQQTRQWAMFLHLSQLANFIVPRSGIVLPIVIWQVKKTELPGIDAHGKNVVNWIISAVIYAIASVILTFCVVGLVPLIALGLVAIVFPIIGGIKANNGEAWKYPLTITFF
jgi:uncharacterized Tic20 family protein